MCRCHLFPLVPNHSLQNWICQQHHCQHWQSQKWWYHVQTWVRSDLGAYFFVCFSLDNFDNWPFFDNFGQFQHDNPGDIWYDSYSWEPEFMTICVTWQLRVTLDSIGNSCNVLWKDDKSEETDDVLWKDDKNEETDDDLPGTRSVVSWK